MEITRTLQMRRSELDKYLIEILDQDTWIEGVRYMLADPELDGRPWPHTAAKIRCGSDGPDPPDTPPERGQRAKWPRQTLSFRKYEVLDVRMRPTMSGQMRRMPITDVAVLKSGYGVSHSSAVLARRGRQR
jgi:hypothetical protein